MNRIILDAEPRVTPAEFYNATSRPGESSMFSSYFRVVVSLGEGGDWAAYFGPEQWEAEAILRGGDKLPRSAALIMFPNVKGRYRE